LFVPTRCFGAHCHRDKARQKLDDIVHVVCQAPVTEDDHPNQKKDTQSKEDDGRPREASTTKSLPVLGLAFRCRGEP
jgi:hypothetical protein